MTVQELRKVEQKLTEDFLDQVAEFFDNESAVHPDTLFKFDGYAITARALLQKIRLHEALDRLEQV